MPDFRLVLYRGKFAAEWYEEGRRLRRSLGTAERSEAARLLKKFTADYEISKRPDRPTVKFAWDGYREFLGPKPAAVTMGHEWKALGPFFGELFADEITEDDCKVYIEKRRKLGRSDGTIWTELGHLRSALRWAEKKNLIVKAPHITRPDRPAPRDKRLTKEEARKFLAACTMPHVRLFAVLAMTTGARMGALLDLTWDRVDFERGKISLHNPDRLKTNKGRSTVPMNKTARAALEEAKKAALSPYVIEWAGEKVGSIKKGLQGAGKRSKLPWVTAHVFRHSAATWMAESGVPMAEIAQVLGHSSSKVTEQVYARFSPKHLQNAASSLEFGDE